MNKKFEELARVTIAKNKDVVISKNVNDGKISIAQEITFVDGKKEFKMFVKNAIICDAEILNEIRNALFKAEEKLQNNQKTYLQISKCVL
jgi:hypothetical protein